MAVRERNGSFQADVTVKGVRHRHTFETKEKAEEWHTDAKHAAKMGREIPAPETSVTQGGGRLETMKDVFELTCRDKWAGKRAAEKLSMNGELFVRWYGENRKPSDIDEAVLSDYVHYCRTKKGNSDATVNRKLSAVRVMLTVARKRKLITHLPEFERYKERTGVVNYLDFKEEDPILTHLKHRGLDALADLVVVLIDTGARVSEGLRIEYDHIQSTGHLFLPDRKSGNMSSIPMTKRVVLALENRRIYGAHPTKPFGEIKQQWARDQLKAVYAVLGGRYADIEQPFHVFRHSCATRLAISGIDASRIKAWMDHSSLLVTQRYINMAPKDLDLACQALEQEVRPTLKVVSNGD